MNSVIDPAIDVEADIVAINHGEAIRHGDLYRVHGRRYRLEEGGRVYPVDGPGIYLLGRGAYRALQVYNTRGRTEQAERMLDREKIDPAERDAAILVWRLGRNED